ncbi:GntR family transcriptional regulator [Pseudarthrobacter sp. YAF2]|uniref:GntR family transcriptional regulator n=1 Tax=Pseudarthrobacter sp. YAF2 TaxID=3233078 RepID=UPI003F9E8B76
MFPLQVTDLPEQSNFHPSVEDNVIHALREDIVHLRLEPGRRLGLEEFAERYGASLTPTRGALRRLETEGLVAFVPRKGSYVAPLSVEDLELIVTVSWAVESRLSRLGVTALTDNDLEQLQQLQQLRTAAGAAGNVDELYRAAWHARDLIAQRAQRPHLMKEAVNWRSRIERYQRFLRMGPYGGEYETQLSHDFLDFISAARDRNGDMAEHVTRRTVERTLTLFSRVADSSKLSR